jgi:hypothetical protein
VHLVGLYTYTYSCLSNVIYLLRRKISVQQKGGEYADISLESLTHCSGFPAFVGPNAGPRLNEDLGGLPPLFLTLCLCMCIKF